MKKYVVILMLLPCAIMAWGGRQITGEVFLVSEEGTALRMAGAVVMACSPEEFAERKQRASDRLAEVVAELTPSVNQLMDGLKKSEQRMLDARAKKAELLKRLEEKFVVSELQFIMANLEKEAAEGAYGKGRLAAINLVNESNSAAVAAWRAQLFDEPAELEVETGSDGTFTIQAPSEKCVIMALSRKVERDGQPIAWIVEVDTAKQDKVILSPRNVLMRTTAIAIQPSSPWIALPKEW